MWFESQKVKLGGGVTSVGILGFPKLEIERKLQGNFQTDFIKLILEDKGSSTEESKVLGIDWGWRVLAVLGCIYKLGTKQASVKRWAF